ncbi:hypothetical protein R3W88_007786 [Solanum pinnatisectum]|uniref:Gag-pol polyprotein n=1 Tax=Solanum pinnatisectum TaxID=50273 RepID=A0AAV9M644_9SOLN|nr:hypothetical protein R3W88_007786 [Solanum pinnatisectum]
MNPSSFTSSSTIEDPENFIEELKKVFDVMHIADTERVELAAYQLKNVARTWFDQWKKGRAEGAPPASWDYFEEAFLGRFIPRELKEAKGSVAQRGNWAPACAKCGRTPPGKCRDGSTGCFKYGQEGYFMKDCPKNRQSNGNQVNRAQSSLIALPDRAAPRGATFGTGGGANRLYEITSRQEQENSPDVVTSMIKVFTLDVYALLDQEQVYLL